MWFSINREIGIRKSFVKVGRGTPLLNQSPYFKGKDMCRAILTISLFKKYDGKN